MLEGGLLVMVSVRCGVICHMCDQVVKPTTHTHNLSDERLMFHFNLTVEGWFFTEYLICIFNPTSPLFTVTEC